MKKLELTVFDLDEPLTSFLPEKGKTIIDSPRYASENHYLDAGVNYTIGRESESYKPSIKIGMDGAISRKQGEITLDESYDGTVIYTNKGQITPRLVSSQRLIAERQKRLYSKEPTRLYIGDSLDFAGLAKVQLRESA